MGAEVVLTRSDVAKGHPEYYQDLGRSIAEEKGCYFINQFGNPDNPLAHRTTTAPEILEQMDGNVDAIVIGVGSSGTVTGFCEYLEENAPDVEIILADPVGSILAEYINEGTLSDKSSSWLVEGIGEDFIPDIADFSRVTKAYAISDAESFAAARELLRKEGLLAGSSSGTLLSAALKYCREQTEPKRVVTFACDTGNKYLSKHLNDTWMEDQGFLDREQHGDLFDLVGRPAGHHATVTVRTDDILTTASNRLLIAGYSHLPVMDGERLAGVITEDAILAHALGAPGKMQDAVAAAMETDIVGIDRDAEKDDLLAQLREHRCVAINDNGRFLGLVTRADLLSYLRRQA